LLRDIGDATLSAMVLALVRRCLFVLATLVAAGCGGGGDQAVQATLTDDGCTYEGPTTPASDDYGRFELAVENETARFAHFSIVRLDDDVGFGDVGRLVDELNRFQAAGRPQPLDDRWTWVSGVEVDPRSASVLPMDQSANAPAGRYVVLCWAWPPEDVRPSSSAGPVPGTIHATGRLILSGRP
jgi:hypothetical protein